VPNNRPILINTKKLILLSYLSYLFRLRFLSEDFNLLEGLQNADKTRMHPKAKLQNASTFTGKESHSHSSLLTFGNKHNYQLRRRQSADTNILIGQCRLSAKWPIIGRYRLSADYPCISSGSGLFLSVTNCLTVTNNNTVERYQ